MKTVTLYLSTAAVAALLAVGFYERFFAGDADRGANPGVAPGSIEDPLWYRAITPRERLLAVRKRLDLMTTTRLPPQEAGPMKDEIALMCFDPAVVDLVCENYQRRKSLGAPQVSAYMEIFARVRHPRFAPLVVDGIGTHREEVRLNALEAAIVQRDPVLVPYLSRALSRIHGFQALKVIDALAAIGNDAALHAVAQCLGERNREPETLIHALTVVTAARLVECFPVISSLCGHASDDVRTMAAWSMAAFGRRDGVDLLVEIARDDAVEARTRCQAIQNLELLEKRETAAHLRALATAAAADAVRQEATIALLGFGDAETLRRVIDWLDSDDPVQRSQAVFMLARSGRDDDVRIIEERLPRLDRAEKMLLAETLPIMRAPAGLELLTRLLEEGGAVGTAAARQLHAWGDAALPILERALSSADEREPERVIELLGAVASIVTPAARDTLSGLEPYRDRRLWRIHRECIRLLDQKLLARAPTAIDRRSAAKR